MSITIAEAIALIPVRPGHPYRTRTNGHEIEVRVVEPEALPAETPADDIWLDVPLSSMARTLMLVRGPVQLPTPIKIADTDLTPS